MKTLFARNSKLQIVGWDINMIVENDKVYIITSFGLLSGKWQEIKKEITDRKRSKCLLSQANKEINADTKLKIKQGYRNLKLLNIIISNGKFIYKDKQWDTLAQTIDIALPMTRLDDNNNLKPMKAQPFQFGKMTYPAYAQPKLNGIRCVARKEVEDNGLFGKTAKFILRSKEGLEYVITEITDELYSIFKNLPEEIAFDGELYIHGESLNNIKASIPMKNEGGTISSPSRDKNMINFHIFDLSVADITQSGRLQMLHNLLHKNNLKRIQNVEVTEVWTDGEFQALVDTYIAAGYEGGIIRDKSATYKFGSRPMTMMKQKRISDSEFIVLDVINKNEIDNRTYICFVLQNDINSAIFEAIPLGNEQRRLEYLINKNKYIGKKATVKYYERSGVNKVPFHATLITIRDYE
jgi:ATP-dependent DNA ligase